MHACHALSLPWPLWPCSPKAPTTFWQTEYDSEFAGKLGLDVGEQLPKQRPSLATPRSLKKGYVHFSEYEKMVSGRKDTPIATRSSSGALLWDLCSESSPQAPDE
jgi:hypothetical protein